MMVAYLVSMFGTSQAGSFPARRYFEEILGDLGEVRLVAVVILVRHRHHERIAIAP